MKLILLQEEVEAILLKWAQDKFDGMNFNTVSISRGYSSDFATLSHEDTRSVEE